MAGEFVQQGGQDILFIAPDEAVASFRIMAGGVGGQGHLAFRGGLIDGSTV